jgi:glycosyltransferase involved in cell wall biosynthesis
MYHANLVGGLAAMRAGTSRIVWNIRTSTLDNERLPTRAVARLSGWLARYACSRIVTNSYVARDIHVRMGYPAGLFQVIPNGFDLERFHPDAHARTSIRAELGLREETPLVGMVARFHPMKDHASFLAAASELARRRHDVHFVLAGSDVEPQTGFFAAALRAPELAGRLHLLGPRRDTPRLATIVADTGIVVPSRDPVALADAWEKLIALGRIGLLRLGEKARERVSQNYSIAAIADRYVNTYRDVAMTSSDG